MRIEIPTSNPHLALSVQIIPPPPLGWGIVVPGHEVCERCRKRFLINPNTGGISFGKVPEIDRRGLRIPDGDIRLLHGRHFAPNRGFGAVHIWTEHRSEMAKRGFEKYQDVPAYVSAIIRRGTQLFHEGGSWRSIRLMGVSANAGTAVLEL